VSPEVLRHIPEESALHYGFVPIGLTDGVLEVGMLDPDNLPARDALQFIASKLGKPFKIFLISPSDFAALLENYKGLTGEVNRALTELGEKSEKDVAPPPKYELPSIAAKEKPIKELEKVVEEAKVPQNVPEATPIPKPSGTPLPPPASISAIDESSSSSPEESQSASAPAAKKAAPPPPPIATELKKEIESMPGMKGGVQIVEDTPITKIVAVILRHAVEGGASDIHIEHTGERVRVRFRVDGVLYTSLLLPTTVHSSVIARIKVLANLKLDEKRKPQDGSFTASIDKRKVDFRVSTFPAYFGEKIVIRILDQEKGVKKLEKTGLRDSDLAIVREAIKRPYGLILLTGPTGSGKSTTLYSMLNELDREKLNVVSLEDPVEYTIEGVSQSQVRPEIDYTFATGLRSIVRQDPDIIMVGEIRDEETAHLAIQAALTGHLVFSTLHTNNATGVIPRLVDMNVEPYLIALTLILAMAQRLVPVMCESSRKPVPVEGALKTSIEKEFEGLAPHLREKIVIPKEVYEAVPSEECPGGTRGRIGVFELLSVDKEIEELILKKPSELEIVSRAREKGMLTMKEDALLKAFQGILSIQAVNQFE